MRIALSFCKMTGAGNDFIVLDAEDGLPSTASELARRLCPRRVSVGADGLLALRRSGSGAIEVDYRNADGSPAAFCGNGARCAARFAATSGWSRWPGVLRFAEAEIIAREPESRPEDVELELPRPRVLEQLTLAIGERSHVVCHWVDAGVPHLVVPDAADSATSWDAVGRALETTRAEWVGRGNLTLMRVEDDGHVEVRTLERGSGETWACGSAALAVAAARPGADTGLDLLVVPPARVPLRVRLNPAPGPAFLSGEARIVYRGRMEF
ncbi:MAG: diaminopimelate epimerase [Acidobacteriota bacterium]|nr:MAG: diaminopimelate epimerase [Acidobacteriota bacterium]